MEHKATPIDHPWQKVRRENDVVGTYWLLQLLNLLGPDCPGDRFRDAGSVVRQLETHELRVAAA
jgi:hypothetical protein